MIINDTRIQTEFSPFMIRLHPFVFLPHKLLFHLINSNNSPRREATTYWPMFHDVALKILLYCLVVVLVRAELVFVRDGHTSRNR